MALVLGRVEVDELHVGESGELRDPAVEVVRREREAFTLHQLDDPSALKIDRGNQHQARLTGTPRSCR